MENGKWKMENGKWKMENNNVYILMTAGRGPVECALAVRGIQDKFRLFLKVQGIGFKIVSQSCGSKKGAIETIVFEIANSDIIGVKPWIGTIKWVCDSPIRKYQKRKNWFIKCEKVIPPERVVLKESDVIFQTFRASGPGGQHRNKVETAVRLIHNKSGIIVTATDGKSQHQNRKKAWEKLNNKIKELNGSSDERLNFEQWNSQLEIERGNPVKIFEGPKFREKK